MRKFLLSALLASGLTLAGAGAYALEDQPQEPQTEEQMNQGTEIEQEAEDTGATEQSTTEESETSTDSVTETDSATDQSQAQGEEYVVQEGDTLASIAKEKLGSEDQWQSIAEANGLENPDQLQVGQRLIIPSSDEMSSEETEQERSFDEGQSDKERFREGTSEQNAPEEETPSQDY